MSASTVECWERLPGSSTWRDVQPQAVQNRRQEHLAARPVARPVHVRHYLRAEPQTAPDAQPQQTPDRRTGNLTEQLTFAIMELNRKGEDHPLRRRARGFPHVPRGLHHVAHDRALDMAMMASMMLSATEFPMKCEASPEPAGLSHRDARRFCDSLVILMRRPNRSSTEWRAKSPKS